MANRPAYAFLALVVGLHFTVGSLLQVANPAFGIAFGEIFFFAGLSWLFTRAQNFRAVDFLALRLPPPRTIGAAMLVAIAGFFFAGGMNALNRWIVGQEVAERYDVTGLFEFRSPFEGALLVIGVSLLAPIGEELAFRGYLQRVLGARHGEMRGVWITAALFALIHLNPASILALFTLGLIFGLLRIRTGSIWTAVLAHVVQNGTSSILVLSGAAENAPDELEIGSALFLLAIAGPALWLAMHHLRAQPRTSAEATPPIDPTQGHRLEPGRVLRPAAALVGAAIASVVLLFAIDGETAGARLQRALSRNPAPEAPPDVETPAPDDSAPRTPVAR